jgi:hypothetical protein
MITAEQVALDWADTLNPNLGTKPMKKFYSMEYIDQVAMLIANQAAEIKRLKDAVVILPEGAEPMVGDLVYWRTIFGYTVGDNNKKYPAVGNGYCLYPPTRTDVICGEVAYTIFQRGGKPVIYEQALNNQTTGD